MIDNETVQSVRELRERGLSPREIARSLQIRPAVASELVRKLAAERDRANPGADQIDCLLNPGWSTGLGVHGHPEWHDPGADDGTGGLVIALVARRRPHRHAATVCVYLLDVYCLGIKNAMGPHNLDDRRQRRLTEKVFSGYQEPPIPAPFELVRNLVFGAAEYAHKLGFDPHPDFRHARAHLGPWSGPSAITFGCNGKPTYISGPYDDTDHILHSLQRAVGRKGFDYTIGLDINELRMAS